MLHVIYEITCPRGDWELPNPWYIGQTRDTVKKRPTQHRQNDFIIEHIANVRNSTEHTMDDFAANVKKIIK